MSYSPRPVRPLPNAPSQDTEEGARTGLTTRIIIVLTVVLGQLWALTVALEAYLSGEPGHAWLLAGFSVLSFVVCVALIRAEPAPRSSELPGRR